MFVLSLPALEYVEFVFGWSLKCFCILSKGEIEFDKNNFLNNINERTI